MSSMHTKSELQVQAHSLSPSKIHLHESLRRSADCLLLFCRDTEVRSHIWPRRSCVLRHRRGRRRELHSSTGATTCVNGTRGGVPSPTLPKENAQHDHLRRYTLSQNDQQ